MRKDITRSVQPAEFWHIRLIGRIGVRLTTPYHGAYLHKPSAIGPYWTAPIQRQTRLSNRHEGG
jgi:hypothetical protein